MNNEVLNASKYAVSTEDFCDKNRNKTDCIHLGNMFTRRIVGSLIKTALKKQLGINKCDLILRHLDLEVSPDGSVHLRTFIDATVDGKDVEKLVNQAIGED